MIRAATQEDFAAILRLNAEWEHVTSPLDGESLARLHDSALYHRVYAHGSRVAAFLLALGPGADYDSPNYLWFDSIGDDFVYIDRVVVDSEYQRAGIADALYRDLLGYAQRDRISRLVCEVDIEPMNSASDRFHERQGFVEVGTQWIAGGSKRVSLRQRVVLTGGVLPG